LTGTERPDPRVVEAMRGKTIAERLDIAFDLWRFARDMAYSTAKARHSELDEEALAKLVAERMSRVTG
jgi:hypothetical protein